MKNKSYYINNFGEKVVDLARDYYETDFNKVLFVEDCKYEDDLPASENVVSEYIMEGISQNINAISAMIITGTSYFPHFGDALFVKDHRYHIQGN